MRLIVAGSRAARVSNAEIARGLVLLELTLAPNKPYSVTEIVSGGASGVDMCGAVFARTHQIPCHIERAKWSEYGPSAGAKRNIEMARYVGPYGALLAFPCGESPGTRHMIRTARELGMRVHVIELDKRWTATAAEEL